MKIWVAGRLNNQQLMIFSCLTWAAWHSRNKVVMGNEYEVNGTVIAAGFVRFCLDYLEYNVKVSKPVDAAPCWSKDAWYVPEAGAVKINTDAFVPKNGIVGLGVVVRDERGIILLDAVKRVRCNWSTEIAEAAAVRYGVEIAIRMGYVKVEVESDAFNTIRAVTKKPLGASPTFLLYEDIASSIESFVSFKCNHVRRAGNTVAHLVARWDPSSNDEYVCTSSFPQSIQSLAEYDLIY